MREQQKEDPLALLQHLPPGEEGAQLQTVKGLNLEAALFLAQFTGSIVYTDIGLHWRHLHHHATTVNAPEESAQWLPVIDSIRKLPFRIESNPEVVLQLRFAGKLDNIGSALRRVRYSVDAQGKKEVAENSVRELARELDEAGEALHKEWQGMSKSHSTSSYQGNLELSVPTDGFERNTVRRLLLTYGRAKHCRPTPMALFMRVAPPT